MKLSIHNNFSQREQLLLLGFIVLLLFFPIYNAEICQVDDLARLKGLSQSSDWSLEKIFIPGSSKRLYYRPLISMTFVFDKYVLGLNTVLMHLENVLYHFLNSILVYFLALRVSSSLPNPSRFIPFISSLLFATSILGTEAINLISGRTDLLACFCVLLSCHLLFLFKKRNRYIFLIASFAVFLAGMLCKETTIAFLPAAMLILIAPDDQNKTVETLPAWVKMAWALGLSSIAIVGFGLLRYLASSSTAKGLILTVKIMFANPEYVFFTWMRCFGFYVKKMIIPWPANYAIRGVDPLYEILAMVLVPLFIYLLIRYHRHYVMILITASVLFFMPSFLIAMNQIAWTSYAERYVYISIAFFYIAAVILLLKISSERLFWVYGFLGFFIAISTVTTFQRNMIWSKNITLFEDTAQKNPYFKTVQEMYAVALFRGHHWEKAETVLEGAASLYGGLHYMQNLDVNLAHVKIQLKKYDEAIVLYEQVLERKKTSHHALEGMVQIYTYKFYASNNEKERIQYYNKIVQFSERWFVVQENKFNIMYNLGKIALSLQKNDEALRYFQLAKQACPKDHEYYEFCEKLIAALQVK